MMRLIVYCCLILLIFAEPTATASGDIDAGCEMKPKVTDSGHEITDFGNYEMNTKVSHFGDHQIETNAAGSAIAVIAIHGGKIERGTTELAYALSSRNHYNYYSYLGVKSKGNAALHIASDQFAEPTALKIISPAATTLSIHGCSGISEFTYIGGRDTELGNRIKEALLKYGFTVLTTPKYLAGLSPHNIANRNKSGSGVQLEISRGLRARFLAADDDSLNRYVLALSEAVNAMR
jgi:phage replication-related protein YjqB (UPF0714/DUF867 family)